MFQFQNVYHLDESLDEASTTTTFNIQVNRGLDLDGQSRIGSIGKVASVDYQLFGGSAILGQDFRGQNGLTRGPLTFGINEKSAYIGIVIINDFTSEQEESFKVRLFHLIFLNFGLTQYLMCLL